MTTKTVWKFPADMATDDFSLRMPEGAEVLSAGFQGQKLMVWALVDPTKPLELRNFHIAGTGHPIEENESVEMVFVGTVFLSIPFLVFHVWETRARI